MATKLSASRAYLLIAALAIGYAMLSTAPASLSATIPAQREYPEPSKPTPTPPAPKPKPGAKKPAPKPPPKPKATPAKPKPSPEGSPDEYIELGDKFASEAKWAEAEAEYRKAVKLQPNNARWRVSLALALTRQRKYAEAEAEYKEAVRIEPNNAQWHAGVGDCLTEQSKYLQAEAAYRRAVQLEPDNVFWRTYLGFALARQKKYAEAETEYRRAAELDPNNATRHAAVGDRLVEQLKYAEAETVYRRAVMLEPNNARWRDYLGYVLIKQQKWAEAEAQYREAVRLEPDERRYQDLLKEVSSKASEKSSPAKTSGPGSPPGAAARQYILDGDRLVKEKKWAEAETAYKRAAELEPNNATLQTKLAIALSSQKKNAEAEAAHRAAVKIEPNKALWHFNLGVVLSRLGKLPEAEAELREAVRLDPKNVQYQGTWKQISDKLPTDGATQTDSAAPQPGARTDVVVDPSGVWSIEVRTPQGNMLLGFRLTNEGGRLAGTFIAQTGTSPIQNATITGNQLRFTTNVKVSREPAEATVTGLIKENLISGRLAIPGRGSFEFTGSKAK